MLFDRVVWPLEKIIDELGWTHSLEHIDAIKYFGDAFPPESKFTQKASPAPFNKEELPSPATHRASRGVPRLQRQESSAYDQAVLFDDEMPVEGHTPERYVCAITSRSTYCKDIS
jgi:hypothetical protein